MIFIGNATWWEELLETGAQIVEVRSPSGVRMKRFLGHYAVAGKAHVTLPAILRQRVALVLAELDLRRRRH